MVTEEIEYHNNISESIVHIPNMGFSITSILSHIGIGRKIIVSLLLGVLHTLNYLSLFRLYLKLAITHSCITHPKYSP